MFKTFVASAIIGSVLSVNPAMAGTVSFAGDSISYGMGKSGGYLNGGIVGAGLSVGNRAANENHWLLFTIKTDLTIVEIGTNDFEYKGKEKYKTLLSKYILPLNDKKNICVVEMPIAVRSDIKKGVTKLLPIEREWAKENNVELVPFPKYTMADRLKDGIHFKPSAYKRFADTVIKECEE